MAHCRLLLLLLALFGQPVAAQTIATSPRPESVSVTVYREPGRHAGEAIDLDWLEGYALISETRTVSIPAGETEIRFEGVAGGIIPQSAIVTGLAEGVIERNHDAFLLSPSSLLDRSLGRRVHVRRTTLATGQSVEREAVIRSGAAGAVVIETAEGVEALRCTGLPETIVYPGVPAGLSARPTLSVRARSNRAVTATVTLSYLASGFDWQANYVITLSPSGDRAEIFAWLTLASMDETSFVDAETMAVAGRLNREEDPSVGEPRDRAPALSLRCWPAARTSDITRRSDLQSNSPLAVVQDEEFQLAGATNVEQVISVTGSRIIARQEELGDVKLYRLPERVTLASNSQKQVALLERADVHVEAVYRQRLHVNDTDGPNGSVRVLVTRNVAEAGLGLPLPAGRVVLFAAGRERPLLLGEGHVDDRAVGEDVEIDIASDGEGVGPMTDIALVREGRGRNDFVVTATNDRPVAVRFELEMRVDEGERLRPERRLARRNGRPLWSVTIPANGTASLRYRVYEEDED